MFSIPACLVCESDFSFSISAKVKVFKPYWFSLFYIYLGSFYLELSFSQLIICYAYNSLKMLFLSVKYYPYP